MSEHLSLKTIERVTSEVLRSLECKEKTGIGIDWLRL